MNPPAPATVGSILPTPRNHPREVGMWSAGSGWFSRLIGLQALLVAFAVAGAWTRTANIPLPLTDEAADEVPVIDFPIEQAGGGPISTDPTAPVEPAAADPLEPVMPELVEATALEDPAPEASAPELVEALPLPPERIPAPPDVPVERVLPRSPNPGAPESTPRVSPQPTARPSTGVSGDSGSASSPVLFGSGGTGRFPLPPYPSEARRRGLEGNVMLRVEVSEQGQPGVPRIESSSGHSSLDRAAVDWVRRRWQWEPGPVRYYRIPFSFKLQ